MVNRLVLSIAVGLGLAACTESSKEQIKLTPHGAAVRANLAAQMINPIPPRSGGSPTSAERSAAALERYRTGEVKDPTEQSTSPETTSIE